VRGQPARRVRRAGTGKPTAETLHGVPSPTQQVQALDRTQPVLPIDFAKTEKRTHDYVRHATTNLFAALDTVTGDVLGECYQRRRTKEFLTFMDQIVARYGDREIHAVLDNLSTHKGDDVKAWLTRHPGVTFHFTPTGSSWLNQVEIWFNIITRQTIRRGTFTSLRVVNIHAS
jgi:DDE superfamily endonuclease